MADPLSITGSIVGLITLADTVFRLVFKYVRSAANAKKDIKLLADEIQTLAGVLQSLRLLVSGLEAEGHPFDPTIRLHHLGFLNSILNRLQERAEKAYEKFKNGSKSQQIRQQLKWPFSTGETKELLEDLIRHKTTISLALSADSLRKIQICLTEQKEQRQTLSSIETTIKRLEIHTQITLSEAKKTVLDFFMKVSPQPNLEISVKLREPTTGLWLTASPSFTTWMEMPGSKLWLSGIPGAGKTVLAGVVIQDAIERSLSHPEVGVAFFFCDYKNQTTWNIVNVLGAIASQISRQNDDAFNSLKTYYDQLHPARGLEMTPDTKDLRDKVIEMSKYFKQTIVIVDGLDECDDNSDDVTATLAELVNYTPNMSMALFSRHEVNIQERLQRDFEHIEIAAQSHDVRLYVAAEMEKRIQNRRLRISNMELKDEVMKKLIDGAKGMFRWVACQLDYLCDCINDADRRKALSELPPDLPETYRRLLERVNRCPEQVKSLVEMCLQFIAFASPRLTITQLQQAVSVRETSGVLLDSSNLVSSDEIARRCSSLIRKSEDGEYFEFSHFSVQEFLTNADLLNSATTKIYYLSKPRSYMLLAMQCLRFLQLKNFEERPESSKKEVANVFRTNSEYSFYEYAAMWWPMFARGQLEDTKLLNLANSLFQQHQNTYFTTWSIEFFRCVLVYSRILVTANVERQLRHHFLKIQDSYFSPLHLAAALAFPQICQSLLDGNPDVNRNSACGSPLDLATVGLESFCGIDIAFQKMNVNGWNNQNRCERLSLGSSTAMKDRIATMELLVCAGATVTTSWSQLGLSLLDLSFLFAASSFDLSVSTKLISIGVEPSSRSPDIFTHCMSEWQKVAVLREKPYSFTKVRMEDSLRDFLSHFIYTPKCKTHTGRMIISLAWTTAFHVSSDLESGFALIGANPTCAEEFLRAKVMKAVLEDDVESLRNCLSLETLDISEKFEPFYQIPKYCCSLLHAAVIRRSSSAIEALLDIGCDLDAQDSNGELPIHLCVGWTQELSTLDLFLQRGADCFATNSKGESIWHKCLTYNHNTAITYRLLELDQNQTTEALLARTTSGHTPLLTALRQPKHGISKANVLAVIDHCAGNSQFWKAHGPVFVAAAKFGSETVIRHLLEAGAKRDPIGDDQLTPLHELGAFATPACAQILKDIYPNAHILRFQGLTPLEMYIERAQKSDHTVDQDLLAVIATPEALSSRNMHGGTVWSFCCKGIRARSLQPYELQSAGFPSDTPVLSLIRLGALKFYEETTRESGILPLFSALTREHKQTTCNTWAISHEILSALILESKYWNDARKSAAAVSFLKKAVRDRNLKAVKLVLEHGVSVHQHVDQMSPIEFAVSNFSIAHESLTPDEACSIEIMMALLSRTRAEEMKGFNPHGLGLGLMHMIAKAHPDGEMHTYWLLRELIRRGVKIDCEAKFKPGWTPLVHHLSRHAFQTAKILLDLGANPFANNTFDAVHASLAAGGVLFLKRLLRYSNETGTPVQWNRTFPWNGFKGISKKMIEITPLHAVARSGLNEILDFYIDEGLLENINVTTADGDTAVHLAATFDQAPVIDRLHRIGASLDVQRDDGSTALHLAAQCKSLSAAKILLELGVQSSLDAFAMTPMMYASALKDEKMIKLLSKYLSLDGKPSTLVDVHSITGKRKKYLAQSLEDAIEKDDLEQCQRLHCAGCSLDAYIPKFRSSPLMKALANERLKIVEWLLQCEVTTLQIASDAGGALSTIECALGRTSLNPILKRLLRLYAAQGGDLINDDHSPLRWAIMFNNEEGLRIFFDFVEEMSERSSTWPLRSLSNEVTASLVKQRIYSNDRDWYCTPLHIAAEYGNISAIEFLLESGADIDECNSDYLSPLECILLRDFADGNTEAHTKIFDKNKAVDAAARLVHLGAATGIVLSCPALLLLEDLISANELLELLFEQTSAAGHKQASCVFDGATVETRHWERIFRFDASKLPNYVSEFEDDFGGKSLMHEAICWRGFSALPVGWNSGLQMMTPFPWHYSWPGLHQMAFLTTSFELYRRRLPHDTFQRIMNLQPERGMSPLCRASSRGILEVMENCLSMGAEMDFEGCSLGSAMMIACASGRLDAVKLLVRRGAAISYMGKQGLTSAMIAGRRSKAIIAWLLVGQFNEQKRLKLDDQPSFGSGVNSGVRFWSGIGKAHFQLIGRHQMQAHESSLEYAKRLSKLTRKLRGSIISGRVSFPTR